MASLPSTVMAQTAYLESDLIWEGDIAVLVIELESDYASLYALDTKPLEKDFRIIEFEPETSRVSGTKKTKYRMHWRLHLVPRTIGKLDVPSLQVGGHRTPRLAVEVLPLSGRSPAGDTVMVELETDPDNPYVGQQTNVTMRLLHDVPILEGFWSEPDFKGEQVVRYENESLYAESRVGDGHNVVERRIAVFAGSPGELGVSQVGYRALLPARSHQGWSDSRWVFRTSEPLKIAVRAVPDAFSGEHWLPARRLTVALHWGETDEMRVGDALEVTMTVTAVGLPGEALPTGLLSGNDGEFRIYADLETRGHRFDGSDLVGTLVQSYTIVFTQPGKIRIPQVKLRWWDVDDDVEKIAATENMSVSVASVLPEAGAKELSRSAPATKPSPEAPAGAAHPRFRPMDWLPFLIGAVTMFIIYGIFGTRVRAHLKPRILRYRVLRRLKRACTANDPAEARVSVISWARLQWPSATINGLYQIKRQTRSTQLIAELSQVDAALYSSHHSVWHGERLWRMVRRERVQSINGPA